jgi:cell division protein FtsW
MSEAGILVPLVRKASRREDVSAISDNILCAAIALVAMGLVMAYSVSAARVSDLSSGYLALGKHLLHVGLAFALMFLMSRLDYRFLYRHRWPIFFAAMALLALVLVPGVGTVRNGARRWFRVAGFSLQPSEFAKLALLALLAGQAVDRGEQMREFFRGLLPAMLLVGVATGLTLLEPDFGTAALIVAIGTAMLLVAGVRVWHLLLLGSPAVAGLALMVLHSPMRLKRVFAFLDPWAYYDGAGYQVIQSLLALGRGGIFGQGPGGSVQKLYFLPEAHSDFVLAVLGEEIGLVGGIGVLALYAVLTVEGMRLSGRASDLFGSLLAFGVTCAIGLQAAINVAVVTASVPTKGIALPFISSGGSSLLANMVGVGILLSVARHTGADPAADATEGDDMQGEAA